MQMGYDFDDGRQVPGSAGRIGGFGEPWLLRGEDAATALAPPHPEWAALRARFHAIHALRRSLAMTEEAATPMGSFLAAGEAVLATCRPASQVVNPIYSGNGKAPSSITGAVAAPPTPGDRGMQ